MAINRLMLEASFGPDEIAVMTAAYDAALELLRLKDRTDPVTELVARKIIEPLRQLEEFTHTTQVIDGYEASVWRDTGS